MKFLLFLQFFHQFLTFFLFIFFTHFYLFIFSGYGAELVVHLFAFIYPFIATIKCMESTATTKKEDLDQTDWLMYWGKILEINIINFYFNYFVLLICMINLYYQFTLLICIINLYY